MMNIKYEILIVDDVSENIKVAISILKNDAYNFSYALNAASAIDVLKKKRFDLILLDVMMPGMDGFDLCKLIKNSPSVKDTPIIFVTAKTDIESVAQGFELGAVDYVTKPFHPQELKSRVATHLELYRFRKNLLQQNKQLTKSVAKEKFLHLSEVELAQKEIVGILSDIMESDSAETFCHVQRVAEISRALGMLEGTLASEDVKMLYLAAPLHDVGKILVDNAILHKNGKLDVSEFDIIKKHPTYGVKILKKSEKKLIKTARIIAYEHHENWDGTGYPRGLKGEEIHIFGRIVAIADVLDALINNRSYKDAWSFEQAVSFILENSGKKFDPRLVNIFRDNLEVFKEIMEKDKC